MLGEAKEVKIHKHLSPLLFHAVLDKLLLRLSFRVTRSNFNFD